MAAPKLCVLCGLHPATTKDHLPPKSIYPKPRDSGLQLFTVPSCSQCNNGDAKADEEFKMVVGFETGEVRDDSDQMAKSLAKTIAHNQRIADEVFSSKKRTFVDRGSGLFTPETRLTFDFDLYQSVVQRIVRGLYWHETSNIASIHDTITVIPAIGMDSKLQFLFREMLPQLETRQLNNDSVRYKFHLHDNETSFWAINIFVRHTVFAMVAHQIQPNTDPESAV